MRKDDLRFLGLIRRAGKLSIGEENIRQAVRAGKARLILLAEDASQNAEKRAGTFAERANVPLLRLDEDKDTLCRELGINGGAMLAVCDEGFAAVLHEKLDKE